MASSVAQQLAARARDDAVAQYGERDVTNRERRALSRRAMAGRDELTLAEALDVYNRMQGHEAANQTVERGVGDIVLGGPALIAEGAGELGRAAEAGSLPMALGGAGKALGGAVASAPVLGPAAKGVSSVAKALMSSPRAATAVGAGAVGATALPSETDAQQAPLTKRQQRQEAIKDAEAKRQQDAGDAETRRQAEAEERRLEQGRKDEAERARIARENSAADAAEKERLAGIERNKTFAQKYPEWADALPGIGIGVAAGVPMVGKMLAQHMRNAPVRAWNSAVDDVEAGLNPGRTLLGAEKAPSVRQTNDSIAKLDQFNKSFPEGTLPEQTSWGPMAASAGFGAGAAMEARAFPDQWNAYNLPSDNPERAKAIERMLDVPTLLKYGALGAASGASGYKAGGWAYPDRRGPVEASKALTERYGDGAASTMMDDILAQNAISQAMRDGSVAAQLAARGQPPRLPGGGPTPRESGPSMLPGPDDLPPSPAPSPAALPAPARTPNLPPQPSASPNQPASPAPAASAQPSNTRMLTPEELESIANPAKQLYLRGASPPPKAPSARAVAPMAAAGGAGAAATAEDEAAASNIARLLATFRGGM